MAVGVEMPLWVVPALFVVAIVAALAALCAAVVTSRTAQRTYAVIVEPVLELADRCDAKGEPPTTEEIRAAVDQGLEEA